jgi:tetratricopeptide (TPR) repeat protein
METPRHEIEALYSQVGRFEEAIQAGQKCVALRQDFPVGDLCLAYAYAHQGKDDRVQEVVDRVSARWTDPTWLGVLNALLGDHDRAFELLQQAVDDETRRMFVLHRNHLFYMQVGPWFDSIRSDPRFADLLRCMNFVD